MPYRSSVRLDVCRTAATVTAERRRASVIGEGVGVAHHSAHRLVLLKGQGYFDVDASVTFTPTAAGAYTVTLFKDGVAVPGATQTITAAAAGTVSVNIPAIVRNQCCDSTSTLTLVVTSATVPATVTIDNTAVVTKL